MIIVLWELPSKFHKVIRLHLLLITSHHREIREMRLQDKPLDPKKTILMMIAQ